MRNHFRRQSNLAGSGVAGIVIIAVLLQLAFYGVIIWGIVKLILWLTATT